MRVDRLNLAPCRKCVFWASNLFKDQGQATHRTEVAGVKGEGLLNIRQRQSEFAFLKERGRAQYVAVTDAQALTAFQQLTQREGILPALESSHAIAAAADLAAQRSPEEHLVVCLSGRGDKDINTVAGIDGVKL